MADSSGTVTSIRIWPGLKLPLKPFNMGACASKGTVSTTRFVRETASEFSNPSAWTASPGDFGDLPGGGYGLACLPGADQHALSGPGPAECQAEALLPCASDDGDSLTCDHS